MMKNKRINIFFILNATAILFTMLCSPASAQMHGNYAVANGKKAGSGYKMLKIHAKRSGTLTFYLEAGRGAPDYNSGSLYGKLTHNNKTGNYEYLPRNKKGGCKLIFIKLKTSITIKTTSGDCGFGYGVSANGKYLLIDHNNPKNFVNRKGNKTYFDATPPDRYSE